MSKLQRTSYQLCNALYSKRFSRNERNTRKQVAELINRTYYSFKIVGSFAEGTGHLLCGSDLDCLFLCNEITDFSLVYTLPGYAKLRKDINKTPCELCKEEFTQNAYYMHNNLNLAECKPSFLSNIVGPAFRATSEDILSLYKNLWHFIINYSTAEHLFNTGNRSSMIHEDLVPAIPYRFKAIMKSWILRRRHHDWPPVEVIKEVSEMPGYLVATGPGNTEEDPDNQYQFRICFTTGEIKLVESWNETQILMYIFLKKLFKQETGTEGKCMTSYIIKNVVLWIAESVSSSWFELRNLFPLIYATLKVMKWMVESKHMIPNYMIPARNMLQEKLDQTQQQELVANLISWIQNAKEEKPFGVIDLTGVPDSEPIDDTDNKSVNDTDTFTQVFNLSKCAFNMILLNPSKEVETYAYILRYIVKSDDFVKIKELKEYGNVLELKARLLILSGLRLFGICQQLGLINKFQELKEYAQQQALGGKEVHDIPLD